MQALDVALICSVSPGFLRSLGSSLAGCCRLMECYSNPEATQMIHLHSPDYSVFDVRSSSPQQLYRTFAAIANLKSGLAALICIPGQLTADQIPHEILPFCRIIELANQDENYHKLVEAILSPANAESPTTLTESRATVNRPSPDSSGSSPAGTDSQFEASGVSKAVKIGRAHV